MSAFHLTDFRSRRRTRQNKTQWWVELYNCKSVDPLGFWFCLCFFSHLLMTEFVSSYSPYVKAVILLNRDCYLWLADPSNICITWYSDTNYRLIVFCYWAVIIYYHLLSFKTFKTFKKHNLLARNVDSLFRIWHSPATPFPKMSYLSKIDEKVGWAPLSGYTV